MAEVKSNIEKLGYEPGQPEKLAMRTLRNLESDSVGRWRRIGFDINSNIVDRKIQSAVGEFMERYKYL